MKNLKVFGSVAVLIAALLITTGCTSAGTPAAQPVPPAPASVPDLQGTWNVVSDGTVMAKSDIGSGWAHHTTAFTGSQATWVVSKQDGRVIYGTFTPPVGKPENFIGVISMDNAAVRTADMDGFEDLQIISTNKMTGVYRQITANETHVAVGTWTRVK